MISSALIFSFDEARDIMNCRFSVLQLPGLKSVARATGTLLSISSLAGGYLISKKYETPGNIVAIIYPFFPELYSERAFMSFDVSTSRWSTDIADSLMAASMPPIELNWSVCNLGIKPNCFPADNISFVSDFEKYPFSQNTSTNTANCFLAISGIILYKTS